MCPLWSPVLQDRVGAPFNKAHFWPCYPMRPPFLPILVIGNEVQYGIVGYTYTHTHGILHEFVCHFYTGANLLCIIPILVYVLLNPACWWSFLMALCVTISRGQTLKVHSETLCVWGHTLKYKKWQREKPPPVFLPFSTIVTVLVFKKSHPLSF